jgi:predicted transcriptional regulator
LAAALVERVAYDSAPKLRLKTLRALTNDWQKTRDVANRIKLPPTTTKRALEDLLTHGLALRDEDGSKPGRTRTRARAI